MRVRLRNEGVINDTQGDIDSMAACAAIHRCISGVLDQSFESSI